MPLPEQVFVHPLVLLSVVDHYRRVIVTDQLSTVSSRKRVVGVLLGQVLGGNVNVVNSFALPFEEQEEGVYFLDHNYLESMSDLFKKVSAKERVVGWYHSGPKMRLESDLRINEEVFRKYCHQQAPVMMVIDPVSGGVPVESFMAIEEAREDGSKTTINFAHLATAIEAEEAEEVGVEHLLRDVPQATTGLIDTSIPTAATIEHLLKTKTNSLHSLQGQLSVLHGYIQAVQSGKAPLDHQINYAIQDMLAGIPKPESGMLTEACNELMIGMTVAELVRSVQALHDCIDNKLTEQKAQ